MARETDILKQHFHRQYPEADSPRIFRAPGRVNLIGEHTDYSLGFVLPIAIDRACYVATAPANDGKLHVFSVELNESRDWPVDSISKLQPAKDWTDYVIGVAKELERWGYPIEPSYLCISSSVPVGSGLSSSAAIEVSSAFALLKGRKLDGRTIAQSCQRAEIEFVGVPCGIMDQYVAVFGEPQRAICIDCRSISHTSVPLPGDVAIVAVNSMVKHDLGASAYRERVRECHEAVEVLRKVRPDIESLRDATSAEVEAAKELFTDVVYRRARHVTTEDERVHTFMAAAAKNDLGRMGELFVASHRSLQHDYEVSSEELDYLVDTALQMDGVYGARMTGGGFGGCTVNLLAIDKVDSFLQNIADSYTKEWGKHPDTFVCTPGPGAAEIFKM